MIQFDDDQASTELGAAEAAYQAARLESKNDVDARYLDRTRDVRFARIRTGALRECETAGCSQSGQNQKAATGGRSSGTGD